MTVRLIQGDCLTHLPTLEQLVLCQLQRRFPTMQKGGFTKALKSSFGYEKPFAFIPDGWFVERYEDGRDEITCIEVEDTSTLSVEKLRAYCDLWEMFDNLCVSLRLIVLDRYGMNERDIDLEGFWVAFDHLGLGA